MDTIYSFSVGQRINVNIKGDISLKASKFLKIIYNDFDELVKAPKFVLNIRVTDDLPKINKTLKLGKDGYGNGDTFIFNTGHFFIRNNIEYNIGIPTRVKRGRIPFKRETPGRHITDEIIEPFLQLLLLKSNATFVHASSVFSNNKVEVLMGWRGTGKTNAILKEINIKEIWSDDLSIIDSEGFVYPYLRPIRIYSYNLPLLNKEYIKKNRLNRKKFLTPPWRPVHYLPIPSKEGAKKAKLDKLLYLNKPDSTDLPINAEEIMKFEQIFFEHYKLILIHSGVVEIENSTKDIIKKALTL